MIFPEGYYLWLDISIFFLGPAIQACRILCMHREALPMQCKYHILPKKRACLNKLFNRSESCFQHIKFRYSSVLTAMFIEIRQGLRVCCASAPSTFIQRNTVFSDGIATLLLMYCTTLVEQNGCMHVGRS